MNTDDYKKLFAMNLQQKLKTKIIGKIFVKVIQDDKLYVQIERDAGQTFKLFLDNFSERILNGWSTDYAVYEVMSEYRKFVIGIMEERYFY